MTVDSVQLGGSRLAAKLVPPLPQRTWIGPAAARAERPHRVQGRQRPVERDHAHVGPLLGRREGLAVCPDAEPGMTGPRVVLRDNRDAHLVATPWHPTFDSMPPVTRSYAALRSRTWAWCSSVPFTARSTWASDAGSASAASRSGAAIAAVMNL